MAVKIFRRL